MPVSKPGDLPVGGGGRWPLCEAGFRSVYHFPAWHVLIYDEPGTVLEINPAAALQRLMDHIEALASGGAVER